MMIGTSIPYLRGTKIAQIETLVDDILNLFDPKKEHVPNEENLEYFAESVKEVLRTRFLKRTTDGPVLRFSALGKQDRQIWYAAHGEEQEELRPQTYVKFLYGDIIEAFVLFLCKEAGHTVEREQEEVEVNGVFGHIDAIIDGVVVDVKSASPFGFKKFKDGSLLDNDPFGYIQQISGYSNVLTPGQGPAFLAFDKVSGELCLSALHHSIAKSYPPGPRIDHLKEVIERDDPPERCYDDVADGKSGNRKLGTECSYCSYKFKCWPNVRTFIYSTGPRYLTKVVKTPEVYEVGQ